MNTRAAPTRIVMLTSILAVLATACGGEEAPTTGEGEEPPAEAEQPEDGGGELGELAERWAETSARVEYRMSGAGAEDQTMTLYWSPPDRWRMDIQAPEGETSIISAGGTSYFCSEAGEAFCFESPAGSSEQAPIPFAGLFTAPGALAQEIESQTAGIDTERSTETIAGEDASCFSISGESAEGQGAVQWCFSSDGILLRYAAASTTTEDAGEVAMEATSVERDVSDADFEPPYPVQEIPTPPAG